MQFTVKKLIIIFTTIISFELINSEKCGVKPAETNNRVVGGKEASPGDIPWQVNLNYGLYSKRFTCGGSLINDQWVVTAAHCIQLNLPFLYQIILGDYKRSANDGTEQVFNVDKIIVHPDWKGTIAGDFGNDIALIKLNKKVKFNNYIGTVCLPNADSNPIGDNALISGWGKTMNNGSASDILMKAFLNVISNDDCRVKLGTDVNDEMICGYDDNNKGGCNGDSGGPLSHKRPDNTWQLIGIVSWTRLPCASNPTVFTHVSKFLDFINGNING